jgi:RHS repeat-associated protein
VYDAAGNVLADGTNTYQWDAEGREISMNSGGTTAFNALGFAGITEPAGHYLGDDPTSGWQTQRIWLGERYLAWYLPIWGNKTLFTHTNAQGTTTMELEGNDAIDTDIIFYPFGQVWAYDNWDELQFFGGMENWDWTNGLGYTPNRTYRANHGRWLSPDPAGLKAVHLDDPQTWNAYAYARNNPATLTDPLGLSPYPCVPGAPGYEDDCPGDGVDDTGGGDEGYDFFGFGGGHGHFAPVLSQEYGGGGSGTSMLQIEQNAFNKVKGAIATVAAKQTVFTASELDCMAAIETGCKFNTNAVGTHANVTYYGMFQMNQSTFNLSRVGFSWNGGTSMFNPTQATEAALGALYAKLGYNGVMNPTLSAVQGAINSFGGNTSGSQYGSAVMHCAKQLDSGDFAGGMATAQAYDTAYANTH